MFVNSVILVLNDFCVTLTFDIVTFVVLVILIENRQFFY